MNEVIILIGSFILLPSFAIYYWVTGKWMGFIERIIDALIGGLATAMLCTVALLLIASALFN